MALNLKAKVLSLADAKKQDVSINPDKLIISSKEYENEYRISVTFDVSEYHDSATDKLLHG